MSSTDLFNPPALIPGTSAASMTWWLVIVRLVTVVVAAALGLNLGFGHDRFTTTTLWLVIAFGVMTVANMATTILQLRREAAETRAGYTSFRRKHLDLPQLDARTGDVIRAAGQPHLGAKAGSVTSQ